MSILDNAKSHFTELVNGDGMRSIDVPEWGESIYFKPMMAMNGMQYQKYFEAASKSDYDGMVDLLILRSRYEDGRKMFKPSDKKELMMSVSPDVVTSVVGRMAEADNSSEEAVKK